MVTNLFIEKTELSWLLHSSLRFNLLGVQSINNVDLPAFSFSRLNGKANGMETISHTAYACMHVCTYSHADQYNIHAFAFSISKFRTIDTSYTLRTCARYRRIKASGFVSCNYTSKHRGVATLKSHVG